MNIETFLKLLTDAQLDGEAGDFAVPIGADDQLHEFLGDSGEVSAFLPGIGLVDHIPLDPTTQRMQEAWLNTKRLISRALSTEVANLSRPSACLIQICTA